MTHLQGGVEFGDDTFPNLGVQAVSTARSISYHDSRMG